MTYSKQPLESAIVKEIENTKTTEADENTCDILAVYNSLNRLCDALGRLALAIQRKNMETKITTGECYYERKV